VQAAVQVNDILAAGTLVQVVNVLRDQRQLRYMAREVGDGQMSRIRLGLEDAHAPPFIPAPDQRRIAAKRFGCGQLARIETLPYTGQRVAEGRDAALGGNASTGEHDDMARRAQGGNQGRWYHVRAPGAWMAHYQYHRAAGFFKTSAGRTAFARGCCSSSTSCFASEF